MALCCYIRCSTDIEVKKCASSLKQLSFSDSGPGCSTQMVVLNSVVTWIVLSYNSFDPIETLL